VFVRYAMNAWLGAIMEIDGTVGQIADLVWRQGPYIGAFSALFFFLLEVFIDIGRTEKRSLSDNIKTGVILAAAFGSVFFAYRSMQLEYEPLSDASRAHREITSDYNRCRTRVMTLDAETKLSIVEQRLVHVRPGDEERTINWLLQLDCLALAVRNAPAGTIQRSQSGWLHQDVALGTLLLTGDEEDDTTIANTLYRMFGIDSERFLGVGRSLPRDEGNSGNRYGEAILREYWIPNVCAEERVNPAVCPTRVDNAWGWRFDSLNAIEDLSLRQLLTDPARRVSPREGADTEAYQRLLERINRPGGLERPTQLLVRFGMFSENRYMGTLGRPEARYVFMSSVADAIDLPIREAFRLSGARDVDESRFEGPDNRAFIWVYEPASAQDVTLATWSNLYPFLHNDRHIDARVREAAEARRWSPPPAPQAAPETAPAAAAP
jgi:hypothetical protein